MNISATAEDEASFFEDVKKVPWKRSAHLADRNEGRGREPIGMLIKLPCKVSLSDLLMELVLGRWCENWRSGLHRLRGEKHLETLSFVVIMTSTCDSKDAALRDSLHAVLCC